MNKNSGKIFPYLCVVIFLMITYILTSHLYWKKTSTLNRKNFDTHAIIIADDIWALNELGAGSYLKLAQEAHHYKSFTVDIPNNDFFIRVTSEPLENLNKYLYQLNIIGLKTFTQEIRYSGQVIGTLKGKQYTQIVYPLLNLLILHLFVLMGTSLIITLHINRKKLEQQVQERTKYLQQSEKRFHDLVNLLPEMVLETDLQGAILYANEAAKIRLDLNFNTTFPNTIDQLFILPDRDGALHYFHKCLDQQPLILAEFTALDQSGSHFPILLRSTPIIVDSIVVGARMILIEITERRRLEEELLRDQKMKAIGLMAGGVAHDLNNILSGIISFPELLLMDLDSDSTMRPPLEALRNSGLDAADVVSDLLTVARGVAIDTEVIGINVLIAEYLKSVDFIQLFDNYPQIDLQTSLAENLTNISGSPIHLRKCLMNLITNGIEAINAKGLISITTSNYTATGGSDEEVPSLEPGKYAKLTIQDSGIGIAKAELEHIFEPFYTKKVLGRSGTGLGLAIVWNTMTDHDGIVNVTSNHQGTTFELFFPGVNLNTPKPTKSREWHTLKGDKQSVLVIDDEPQQRLIARQLLSMLNYEIETVSSGEEAVRFLQTRSVDILLLDMIMTPGQNGRITYEQILQLHPEQKAIVASGYAADEDVKATLDLGAAAFVSKPYTVEQIGSALYNIFYP